MTDERYGDVSVTWHAHVAVTVIDRPPNNFVTTGLIRDLADCWTALDDDPRCRALVLATQGQVFCAGADLTSPRGPAGGEGGGLNPLYEQAVRLFSNRKPVVAAIQGAAVGAGLGLALAADFRVAGPQARFVANFVKLGFHAGFGITHTLPRLIGLQRASLMLMTGRRIKAEEALSWGLADEVTAGDTRAAALALAQEIAEAAPLAVQATRMTLRSGLSEAVRAQTDLEFAEQHRLMQTADFREGVRAVGERRPGAFTGA